MKSSSVKSLWGKKLRYFSSKIIWKWYFKTSFKLHFVRCYFGNGNMDKQFLTPLIISGPENPTPTYRHSRTRGATSQLEHEIKDLEPVTYKRLHKARQNQAKHYRHYCSGPVRSKDKYRNSWNVNNSSYFEAKVDKSLQKLLNSLLGLQVPGV